MLSVLALELVLVLAERGRCPRNIYGVINRVRRPPGYLFSPADLGRHLGGEQGAQAGLCW